MSDLPYQLLADAVLSLHVAIVVFVAGGLILIVVGNLVAWDWVNALWLRLAHLAAIAIVVAEAWFGAVCPLTSLEISLRAKARATTYAGTFIEHWLQRILYYEAPGVGVYSRLHAVRPDRGGNLVVLSAKAQSAPP